jgi:hypothetical protein
MTLPPELANVRKRPSMYLPAVSYDAAATFVLGYDAATQGGLLVGLREWLIVKLQDGNNLSWPSLILELMRRTDSYELTTEDAHKRAIEFMFVTLERFLAERDARSGLRRIYLLYESWLRQQEWYTPSSPDWMPLD